MHTILLGERRRLVNLEQLAIEQGAYSHITYPIPVGGVGQDEAEKRTSKSDSQQDRSPSAHSAV